MDAVLLSRLQFAAAAAFHFLFVPLTLGLSIMIAVMETHYVRTGREVWKRATRFWGRIFIVNFAIGVVTGLTLEFQFGTNWGPYATFVGDIFGSLLAIEATVAFFLESTFLAVWIFGWNRVSPKLHCASFWIVTLASCMSAFWIICANGWMQNPQGYEIVTVGTGEAARQVARITGFGGFMQIITSWTSWLIFLHTMLGSFLVGGFFVLGVSAYHLLKGTDRPLFSLCFRMAAKVVLFAALFEAFTGHYSGMDVAKEQPAKLAAMESHWETEKGAHIYMLTFPDEKNGGNYIEMFPVPYALSFLAHGRPDAEVVGLNEIPEDERPPVTIVFLAFRIMVGLGTLFIPIAFIAWWWRKRPERHPIMLNALIYVIPLPYIALQAGWIVTEVGRQPWIVWHVMRVKDAASNVPAGQVLASLIGLIGLYSLIALVNFTLLFKLARQKPGATEKKGLKGVYDVA